MKLSILTVILSVFCSQVLANSYKQHRNDPAHLPISVSKTEGYADYMIQKNDTLMLIAFEVYSDFSKWKEIKNLNEDVLKDFSDLPAGQIIKLKLPLTPRVFPEGNPYLIKKQDTLGKISQKVYGKSKHWKSIYENNKDQIKNPNIIFAGFTLFYKPVSENEPKLISLY